MKEEDVEIDLMLADALAQDIETLSMVINPKIAVEYIKMRTKQRKDFKERLLNKHSRQNTNGENINNESRDININNIDINNDEEVKKVMKECYDTAPNTMTVPNEIVNSNKYILPTFNRKDLDRKNKKKFITMQVDEKKENQNFKLQDDSLSKVVIRPKGKNRKKIENDLRNKEEGDNNGNG